MNRLHDERKRSFFASLPSSVVELGPGTGANFAYYPRGTQVIAIEPNERMWPDLRARAQEFGIELELRGLRGENIDLASGSAEIVVCTLVLCSVDEPKRVVDEALRILRPGGRFVFIEHVAAPVGSVLRAVQNGMARPWSWLFEGCCPNRETVSVLNSAGFSSIEVERFEVRSLFMHVSPHAAGMAIK